MCTFLIKKDKKVHFFSDFCYTFFVFFFKSDKSIEICITFLIKLQKR